MTDKLTLYRYPFPPEPYTIREFIANGHDAAASARAAKDVVKYPKVDYWLTPSLKPIEEGKRYKAQWLMRFRSVRSGRMRWHTDNPGVYVEELKYKGRWHIVSEALEDSDDIPLTDSQD